MVISRFIRAIVLMVFCSSCLQVFGEVSRIETRSRETLSDADAAIEYEVFRGELFYTLDPQSAGNQPIVDIGLAPRNDEGLVEFSTDFELFVPKGNMASDVLLYSVNNRGTNTLPPELGLDYPLTSKGYTYLSTGWINELAPGAGRMRLHAPTVSNGSEPVTGVVRYEIITNRPSNTINIAGANHLAYTPSDPNMVEATLTKRVDQLDPRIIIAREQYSFTIVTTPESNQPMVSLTLEGGLEAGVIYELIYEAKDPVLSGAGMAAMRDIVSLFRNGTDNPALQTQLSNLGLPAINHTVAWGISQSGRLLRQFVHHGFNEDLAGRKVFDGIVPIIAGAGFGMFNTRFAMPTRTNGQHENFLYPNDYFPFTYGESTDPYSGRVDGILLRSRRSNTEPKVMHIQTSNEYWVRAGSLAHTNPLGTEDAQIPGNVRFYTIGGSQHVSGSGIPSGVIGSGQLPSNHNNWTPIANTLLVAMVDWVSLDKLPPPSRYPKIADGTLVASHLSNGAINPEAWRPLDGYKYPKAMYQVGSTNFGAHFLESGIIERHPMFSNDWYGAKVPKVDNDNNDLPLSTVLPPLTAVPLGTFVPWNLRNPVSGAETELARLSGAYIPFAANSEQAQANGDFRSALSERYENTQQYLAEYAVATDWLIQQGYLLPEFRADFMDIAIENIGVIN